MLLDQMLIVLAVAAVTASAASRGDAATPHQAAGDPADIAPSAYLYRADRPPDTNDPESWILLMQYARQPFDKPAVTDAPEIRVVRCALLWEEVREVRRVELTWPKGHAPRPSAGSLVFMDASKPGIHTWWNCQAPPKEADEPQVSADGRTFSYTLTADTFGLLVCARDAETAAEIPVPAVRVYGADVWKQMDIELEWGFEPQTSQLDYSGKVEARDGLIRNLRPLAGDDGTRVTGRNSWRSPDKRGSRRGVSAQLLYIGSSSWPRTWPMDSRREDVARTLVTVRTRNGVFSFLASDLEKGPILAPECGFFVGCAGCQGSADSSAERSVDWRSRATTARQFVAELASRGLKTTRQRARESKEQTWRGAVSAMYPDQDLPPIPRPEFFPAMRVEVPSAELQAQWDLGVWHIMRRAVKKDGGLWRFNDYPYALLASENYLILRALDLMGMHREAADGLGQWLEIPLDIPKPVGWFSDGRGAFSHAKDYVKGAGSGGFAEDVGGGMDSVHAMGPGAIGYALVEHYRMTGDREWLKRWAPRLVANAEWIIRQRGLLARNIPGGERLWCRGLQPAHQVTPDSGGMLMQFYESDAYYLLAVEGLAEILADVDRDTSRKLAGEAKLYRSDLEAAVARSVAMSPVLPVRDGTSRSFIPFACYVRGPASAGWNWRRPGSPDHVNGLYWDSVQSAGPLVSPAAVLPASDARVQGYLDVLEDRLLLENERLGIRTPGYDADKDWFAHAGWHYQCGLERHANIHLDADDPECFLRSMLNQYAVEIMPGEYTFREHTTTGPPDKSFEEAAFLERFRCMLLMEDGRDLWLGRAVPRSWLEQGKTISVNNAPSHFGTVSYRISSDVDHGAVNATVHMPTRNLLSGVLLRLRHPQGKPMRSVTVNGKLWKQFDPAREIIRLSPSVVVAEVRVSY